MLYQVYLVDDEEIALRDLEKNIPWNDYGFEVIGKNINPSKAIEEIYSLCPQVVFTDVKMPIISGLDLIVKVRETLPGTEFVIVSAHSDFPLVRHSFLLNIADYLLKPVSHEDYKWVLQHLLQKLNEKNDLVKDACCYDGTKRKLKAILDYIGENIEKKHSLSTISKRFYLSPNTICQYFSKYLNTTFVNYLTELRMQHAKKLLAATDKTVKEIAVLCGYEDYFYFCKVFQSYFHCTPTQLRRKETS